jgi:resuscitation-promoting factor RpfB
MKKVGAWFMGLSRVGKFGVVSAALLAVLVVGSAAGAPDSTPAESINAPDVSQQPVITTRTETETIAIPFEKQTVEVDTLEKGSTELQTAGVDGVKTLTHTVTLEDGIETDRTTKEAVTKQPVHEITRVGTYVAPPAPVSNCDPNYSGCVPRVSYDLDCADIGYSVRVLGNDPHRLDGDNDGYGCESY